MSPAATESTSAPAAGASRDEGAVRPHPRLFLAGLVVFTLWIVYLAFVSSQG